MDRVRDGWLNRRNSPADKRCIVMNRFNIRLRTGDPMDGLTIIWIAKRIGLVRKCRSRQIHYSISDRLGMAGGLSA
jgi:hypothetical protein